MVTITKPPFVICECGNESQNSAEHARHAREIHGFITVYGRPSGRIRLVPILSHPAHLA